MMLRLSETVVTVGVLLVIGWFAPVPPKQE